MRVPALGVASGLAALVGGLLVGGARAGDTPAAVEPVPIFTPTPTGTLPAAPTGTLPAAPTGTPPAVPTGTPPAVPTVPGKGPVKPPAKKPSDTTQPTKRGTDREVGQMLYERSCWQCHGRTGLGDGPAAEALVGGVASLKGKIRSVNAEKIENIDALITVVQDGTGAMPAYSEDIDRADSRRLLFYVRDVLEGKAGPEAPVDEEPGGDGDAPAGDAPAEGQ